MKFEEIIPALIEGKKIRRRRWVKNAYISIGIDGSVCDQNNEIFPFVLNDFKSEFWEIVEEKKKVKLRDLTKEQYSSWIKNNCTKYGDYCNGCPFQKVRCDNYENKKDWQIDNKDLYSDKFLNQEIEVEK